MHPIHYSLIFNALVLLVFGGLAWFMNQPLLVVIGVFVMQHMVGRFEDEQPRAAGGPGMSFGFVPGQEGDTDDD